MRCSHATLNRASHHARPSFYVIAARSANAGRSPFAASKVNVWDDLCNPTNAPVRSKCNKSLNLKVEDEKTGRNIFTSLACTFKSALYHNMCGLFEVSPIHTERVSVTKEFVKQKLQVLIETPAWFCKNEPGSMNWNALKHYMALAIILGLKLPEYVQGVTRLIWNEAVKELAQSPDTIIPGLVHNASKENYSFAMDQIEKVLKIEQAIRTPPSRTPAP